MPVYKDKERNTWYCSFYYADWTGDRKKKKKEGFRTQAEAKKFEREFLAKQQDNCDMDFKILVELYLEDLKARVRASTYESKKSTINTKVLPYFGNMNANKITANHVRKWQNKLKVDDLSQTYIRQVNTNLGCIFNFAVKFYNLASNPVSKCGTIGKGQAERMQFWTVDEFKEFISHIDNPADSMAFKLLFWTGIRHGELMALAWKDIDLDNYVLNVNKSFIRLLKEDITSEPKTAKSKRKISLATSLTKDIIEYRKHVYESDKVFIFSQYHLRQVMSRICKKHDLKQIRVHDLRHSHASLLIEMGFSPLLISERLGHEKVQTTLDIYAHLYPHTGSEVAKKLDNIYF